MLLSIERFNQSVSTVGFIQVKLKFSIPHGTRNETQIVSSFPPLRRGHFRYQASDSSFQHLLIISLTLSSGAFQENNKEAFQIIELRVLSNWGHPEYTCLYRFRVHGEPVQQWSNTKPNVEFHRGDTAPLWPGLETRNTIACFIQ